MHSRYTVPALSVWLFLWTISLFVHQAPCKPVEQRKPRGQPACHSPSIHHLSALLRLVVGLENNEAN